MGRLHVVAGHCHWLGNCGGEPSGREYGNCVAWQYNSDWRILVVLITILDLISGAHFDPAVTFAFLLRGEIQLRLALAYAGVQIVSAVRGTILAHCMFKLPLFQESTKLRPGIAQRRSEFVANFGLLATIFGTLRYPSKAVPMMVGLCITAAYWFTASTSFANPAVTIAPSFTNTSSGIFSEDAHGFIVAQLAAPVIGAYALQWLFAPKRWRLFCSVFVALFHVQRKSC